MADFHTKGRTVIIHTEPPPAGGDFSTLASAFIFGRLSTKWSPAEINVPTAGYSGGKIGVGATSDDKYVVIGDADTTTLKAALETLPGAEFYTTVVNTSLTRAETRGPAQIIDVAPGAMTQDFDAAVTSFMQYCEGDTREGIQTITTGTIVLPT